jgi:hypothetical protein
MDIMSFALLRQAAGACGHFVVGRSGGDSAPPYDSLNLGLHVGDDPERVVANRRRVAAALGLPLSRFVFADQVHGRQVAVITPDMAGRGTTALADALPGTDAMITVEPGLCLLVLVADCVPVLLLDPVRRACGAAHAGWRGTVQDVAGESVRAMVAHFGCRPADLRAVLGPAAGPEGYEVDGPVMNAVTAAFGSGAAALLRPTRPGHALLDLWAANRHQLRAAGVPDQQIEVAPISTLAASHRFYSARVAAGPTGRFGAGIFLRPTAR